MVPKASEQTKIKSTPWVGSTLELLVIISDENYNYIIIIIIITLKIILRRIL